MSNINREVIAEGVKVLAILFSLAFMLLYLKRVHAAYSTLDIFIFFVSSTIIGEIGAKLLSVGELFLLYGVRGVSLNYELLGARTSGAYLLGIAVLILYRYLDLILLWSYFLASIVGVWIIGKWSCFVLGDSCYGIPTSCWTGVIVNGIRHSSVHVHPVPIYDSIFGGVILMLILLYEHKIYRTKVKLFISLLALSSYGIMIEFIRINPKVLYGLSINQIAYILILLLCSYQLLRLDKADLCFEV